MLVGPQPSPVPGTKINCTARSCSSSSCSFSFSPSAPLSLVTVEVSGLVMTSSPGPRGFLSSYRLPKWSRHALSTAAARDPSSTRVVSFQHLLFGRSRVQLRRPAQALFSPSALRGTGLDESTLLHSSLMLPHRGRHLHRSVLLPSA